MNKVKTLDDLRKMRESLRASLDLREKSNNPEQMVQIKGCHGNLRYRSRSQRSYELFY